MPPNANFEDEDEVIFVSFKPGKSVENVKMEKQNTACYIILCQNDMIVMRSNEIIATIRIKTSPLVG